jgi:hypothetical protein
MIAKADSEHRHCLLARPALQMSNALMNQMPNSVTERASQAGTARAVLSAILIALAPLPMGCAGSAQMGGAPAVSGNEQGGKVPYAEGGMQAAGDAARAHCSQFGKKAQITQMQPAQEGGGGTIGFQCR